MVIEVWVVFRWVILYCSGFFGDSNEELVRIPMNQPVFMKWDIIKFLFCCHYQLHSGNLEASFQSPAIFPWKFYLSPEKKNGSELEWAFATEDSSSTNGTVLNSAVRSSANSHKATKNPDEPKYVVKWNNISPSPRFPWNSRGFPFQNATFLGWKLGWGRYNLTRKIMRIMNWTGYISYVPLWMAL